jgi:hypothetical protein
MRTHLVPLAAALALGVSAAPALAAGLPSTGKDIAYAIQLDGEGTYKYSERVDRDDTDWYGHDVNLSFGYHGAISDGVVFRDGSPIDTTGDDLANGFASGGWLDTGSVPALASCASTEEPATHGWMRLLDDVDINGGLEPLDGNLHLWLRPFDKYEVRFDCGGDSNPVVDLVLPSGADENAYDDKGNVRFGHNPFDIDFQLPKDIIGMGYIEQLIPATTVVGAACPGWINDMTTECKLEWHATIKLTKLWERAIPRTPPQPAPDDDLLVPLVPQRKAKLSRDGSRASFSVSCPAGCTGSASLTAGTGATPRAASAKVKTAKPLARVTFKVAKGKTRRVTLRLGRKARRAVRRAGGARVVVRITTGGKRTTKTLTLRLPRSAARR